MLQEALRPLLLRRMKEDVEDLPEKEEVIVWVRLTTQQHAYYKAIYSKQVGDLLCNVYSSAAQVAALNLAVLGVGRTNVAALN